MSKGTILLFLKLHIAAYLRTKFKFQVILFLSPPHSKRTPKTATQIGVKIDPLQLFLKSYKDNFTTLILCNKASTLKLKFKIIFNTNRAGKLSNRNFVEIIFAEQAAVVPSSFRTVVLITLRMEISKLSHCQ